MTRPNMPIEDAEGAAVTVTTAALKVGDGPETMEDAFIMASNECKLGWEVDFQITCQP